MPNITGLRQVTWGGADKGAGSYGRTIHSGAIYSSPNTSCSATVDAANFNSGGSGFGFDASRSNPIYGRANTVQPPAITLLPQIKY